MNRLRLLSARFIGGLLPLLVIVATAAAQEAPRVPTPTLNRSPHPAWGFALMAILLIAVIAVSIMPSKRGHQD